MPEKGARSVQCPQTTQGKVDSTEREHSLSKAKLSTIERGHYRMGDGYVLSFTPPRDFSSQSLCNVYKGPSDEIINRGPLYVSRARKKITLAC